MKKYTIYIFLILTIFTSACGGINTEPTPDSGAVLTQAALLADQGLTQTAAAAPPTQTFTPTTATGINPTATFISIPTNSLSPTAINTQQAIPPTSALPAVTVTSTSSGPAAIPTATAPTGNTSDTNCYKASYESETAPFDYSKFPVDSGFNKMWKVKNIGTCTWTENFSLVLIAAYKDGQLTGEAFGNPPVIFPVFHRTIIPNDYAWVSINMKTPSEPGIYAMYYKFQTEDGKIFGIWGQGTEGSLWIKINITK